MAIPLRKKDELQKLRTASLAVAKTLEYLSTNVKAGMTLKEVDKMGEEYLVSLGARPSFKGLYGFPSAVCTSLNEVVIHGIPDNRVLKDGDILGMDVGSEIDGWYGDGAVTIPIGDISAEAQAVIDCSKEALLSSIEYIKVGMRFKELSAYLEDFITSRGYQPLDQFCGHGIGRKPHGEPDIPNYVNGSSKSGPKIKEGMVFCIEPMVCHRSRKPIILEDKWSVVSEDKMLTSHYEHTVAIINGKAEILTQV